MSELAIDEQIRMYSKLLKVPTFNNYGKVFKQASPDANVGEILLSLMKAEYEQRQDNQNQRRLKQAGFPYTKTLEELDISRYSGEISENTAMVAAMIDRLTFNSYVLDMNGESYRLAMTKDSYR